MYMLNVGMSPAVTPPDLNARHITANWHFSKSENISLKHQALFSQTPHLCTKLENNYNTPDVLC